MLASFASAAEPECVDRMSRGEVGTAFERAERMFLDLDDAGFRDRFNELAGIVLPCTGDLVPPPLAARYHRLMAIHLYGLGARDGAVASIRAARWAAEGDALPADLLAPTHELAQAAAADPDPPKTQRVPEPRAGSIAFDGLNGRDRPVGVPTLVQVFDESGQAVVTDYIGPRDPLPEYRAVPRRRNLLVGVGVGAGAGAVAAFAGSFVARENMYTLAADPAVGREPLDQALNRTNLLATLGGVGLAVSVGAGTAAFLVGSR